MRGPKNTNKNFFKFVKIRAILLLLLIISLGGYLVTINKSATLGIEISGLQQEIKSLKEINHELEVEISSLQSISRIELLATDLNMVSADQYNYVDALASVAVK